MPPDDLPIVRSLTPPGFWIGNVFYSDTLAERILSHWSDGPTPQYPDLTIHRSPDLYTYDPGTFRFYLDDSALLPCDTEPGEGDRQ